MRKGSTHAKREVTWLIDHVFLLVPAQQAVAKFLGTFREFPPRQKAASFTIDQVMEKLTRGLHS